MLLTQIKKLYMSYNLSLIFTVNLIICLQSTSLSHVHRISTNSIEQNLRYQFVFDKITEIIESNLDFQKRYML